MKIGRQLPERQATDGRHDGTVRREEVRLGPYAVAKLAKELQVQESFQLLAKFREQMSGSVYRLSHNYPGARMEKKLEGLYMHIRLNANNNDRLHEALVEIRQLEKRSQYYPPTLCVLKALRGLANGCIDLRTQIPILERIDEQIARERALEAHVHSLEQSQRDQAEELQRLQMAKENQAQEIQNLHMAKTSLAMQGEKALREIRKNHEREMAQLRAQLAHVNVQMASHQQMMEAIVRRCILSGRSDEGDFFRLHDPYPAGEIEHPSLLSSFTGSDLASTNEWTNLNPSSGLSPPPSPTGSGRSDSTL